jgi:hypothetical protein
MVSEEQCVLRRQAQFMTSLLSFLESGLVACNRDSVQMRSDGDSCSYNADAPRPWLLPWQTIPAFFKKIRCRLRKSQWLPRGKDCSHQFLWLGKKSIIALLCFAAPQKKAKRPGTGRAVRHGERESEITWEERTCSGANGSVVPFISYLYPFSPLQLDLSARIACYVVRSIQADTN